MPDPATAQAHTAARQLPSSGHRGGVQTGGGFPVQLGLLLGAVLVILDQATKELAERTLSRGRMVDVFAEGWGWQLTYNPGGAWGLPAPSWFFLAVTVVVAVIVARNLPRVASLTGAAAYGLLLAGALGNALDRVFRAGDPGDPRFLHGHVVDFLAIELPFIGAFPRFNVADVAITCGFVLLMIAMWREERQAAEAEAGAGERSPTAVRS